MNAKVPQMLPYGPVMTDIAGTALTDVERERLLHPLVGGVILFARNFSDSSQLKALTQEIRGLRSPELLIAVDHEGGRVQRFRTDAFTRIPAMSSLGQLWDRDSQRALETAHATGYVLAADLRLHGIDLSFTPVLDLDYGVSRAIGNRAFHRDPHVVINLACSLIQGLSEAGMGCVGKHFPGHGFIEADSHHEIPVDCRDFEQIWAEDMLPYRRVRTASVQDNALVDQLSGIMPAHVIYEKVDRQPAGFSAIWLQDILRQKLEFTGIVFSDDLNMQGAMYAGDIVDRAAAAYRAGCDMVLVCNQPHTTEELLARWQPVIDDVAMERLTCLSLRSPTVPFIDQSEIYQHARKIVCQFIDELEQSNMTDKTAFLAAETIGSMISPS